MLTHKKYIISTILPPLLMLIFVLTSLVWITQILKLLYLIDKGIKLQHFLSLIILILPSLLFMIMPLITVIGIVYVYNKLNDERQIIILRCSGLNNLAIAKPALLVATTMTIISYYISAFLIPLSYNNLKQELNNFRENYISKIIDAKTFNQISKYITIYVDKKNSDNDFEGIILFDNRIPANKTILFAKSGKVILQNQVPVFKLKNGLRHAFDNQGNLTKLYFDKLTVEIKNKNTNDLIRNKTSLELYIPEMLWPDNNLSSDRRSRLIIDGHQRIIWPLYNYILVFTALSIYLNQPYNRKSNTKTMIYTSIPLILIAYSHFTFLKMAYKNTHLIFLCYFNIFVSIIFSIWQSTKRKI